MLYLYTDSLLLDLYIVRKFNTWSSHAEEIHSLECFKANRSPRGMTKWVSFITYALSRKIPCTRSTLHVDLRRELDLPSSAVILPSKWSVVKLAQTRSPTVQRGHVRTDGDNLTSYVRAWDKFLWYTASRILVRGDHQGRDTGAIQHGFLMRDEGRLECRKGCSLQREIVVGSKRREVVRASSYWYLSSHCED